MVDTLRLALLKVRALVLEAVVVALRAVAGLLERDLAGLERGLQRLVAAPQTRVLLVDVPNGGRGGGGCGGGGGTGCRGGRRVVLVVGLLDGAERCGARCAGRSAAVQQHGVQAGGRRRRGERSVGGFDARVATLQRIAMLIL